MGAAGGAWVSGSFFVMIYSYMHKEMPEYYLYCTALPLLFACCVALLYVYGGRLAEDPERAMRGGLVLDRTGLTFSDWRRHKLFWQEFAEVRHEIVNLRGVDTHYLDIRLHDWAAEQAAALKRPFRMARSSGRRLRYPLSLCSQRPEVIVATMKAFLERARWEQGFLPARPPEASPSVEPG